MRDEIAAALRRTGAYLSHLGRLKLGVATSAREEAPLSGVKTYSAETSENKANEFAYLAVRTKCRTLPGHNF